MVSTQYSAILPAQWLTGSELFADAKRLASPCRAVAEGWQIGHTRCGFDAAAGRVAGPLRSQRSHPRTISSLNTYLLLFQAFGWLLHVCALKDA